MWDTTTDEIFSKPFNHENSANTKRLILQTIASQYDIYNFAGSLLNRVRLFLHEIRCDKSQSWDDILYEERLKEWRNICKQANGDRKRDNEYSLICFSDASKSLLGVVIYLYNHSNKSCNFIMAKHKLINNKMNNLNNNNKLP